MDNEMIVLKWLFPVFLAALAVVHLVSCWRGDDDLRKPTKVALMPVVALTYLAFANTPSLWVVAGLLFGCLGDLFLLRPLQKHFFALGTASFFLGHVCYLIFIYTHYAIRVGWVWIVVISAVYAAGAAFVYANSRRNIPRALRPLALAYMVMLCTLSISVFLPLVTAFTWGKLASFLGASFFLTSDGVLCDMLFTKKAEPTKQNFAVMGTYILAQVLLTMGFAF
ncbi:MAG: lysoplasmalogenase [Clostridiales bacterium]|nr:lysoplasmalogenase [Clostridiales bacterium]